MGRNPNVFDEADRFEPSRFEVIEYFDDFVLF